MKKALSVLLTAAMLLGCFSVGLVSFAAAPADEAAMATLLKDTTTYATKQTSITVNSGKWNENTYISYPASYSFIKTADSSATLPDESVIINAAGGKEAYEENVLKPIEADGSYESYITRDKFGTATAVNVAKIISDTLPLSNMIKELGVQPVAQTNCEPGKTGSNPIGEDALKVIELSAEDIKNYNTASGAFTLDDIVLVDQTADEGFVPATTEDSSLAKIVAVMASSKADELLSALKSTDGISDITNYVFKLTNINVTPVFSTKPLSEDRVYGDVEYAQGDEFTTLSSIVVSYAVVVEFDARFTFSDVAFPVSAGQNVKTSYNGITEVLGDTTVADDVIDIIEAETAYVAEAATGTDAHHAGGYSFSKTVEVKEQMYTNGLTYIDNDTRALLDNILKDKYPEFNGYLSNGRYFNEAESRYLYDDMLKDKTGLSSNGDGIVYNGTVYDVTKGVNGSEILGLDALKAMTINTDDIKSYTYSAGTATIKLNDQTIMPSDGEEVIISSLYDNMLPEGLDEEIASSFKSVTKGSTIEDIEVSYTNTVLTAGFDTDLNLTSIKLEYDLNYSATLYLADMVNGVTVSGLYHITVNYNNIEKFDEENDIDPYDLADAINQATAYALINKAGYAYERNANFANRPTADVSESTIGSITGVLDTVLGFVADGVSVSQIVNNAIADFLLGDMDVTDFSGVVPVTEDGVDYLGENYALKATSLEANDLANIAYNSERGVITFNLRDQLNPEKDEMNALSRLTNDFTSATDLRNKLGLQISDRFGIPFISDDEPCDVKYTNIDCYVAFTGADEENVLGDGTLSVLGVGYDCDLEATFSGINIKATEKMTSEYNDFDYFDYEMGDVDMSTRVSVVDAKLVLQMVAGLTTLEGKHFELADMNYDGKISVVDAKLILQKIAAR